MSQLSNIPDDKLAALMQIRAEGRSILLGQITKFTWPQPTGPRYYAPAPYDRFPEFNDLPLTPIEVRLTASNSSADGFNAYITDLTFNVDVEDSKINIDLSNGDGAIEDTYLTHGWGVPVEVFYYFPQVDLLVSRWFGYLDPVLSASNPIFKATASRSTSTASLSSRRRDIPGAAFYPHCVADFPPEYPQLLPDLSSVSLNDCPYNRHLGGSVGLLNSGVPFTSCDRSSTACKARFGNITNLPYLGFDNVQQNDGLPFPDPTLGSRTVDQSRGNSSNLSEPVRVVFGRRVLKNLDIVQITIQVNVDHPERGSVTITTINCEGPVQAESNIQINNIPVDPAQYQIRLGTVQQQTTGFVTAVKTGNYSSRCVSSQVQKGDFRGAAASGLNVRATIDGLNNIRIYTTQSSFFNGYTTNPAWCGLEAFRNRRWGLGVDLSRLYLQDWIDIASWFDVGVSTFDASGSQITSTRATFNAEWRGRKAQDQIRDFCLYRRISLPFPFEGKLRVIPLRAEALDQYVPVFTDRLDGRYRNILPGQDGISSADYQEIDIDEQVNELVVKFDDATLDDMAERPLLFTDLNAQRAAGARAGDNTLMKIKKEHFLAGITNLGEAIRQGNILLDLGEFDEGGLVNPIRVTFNCSLLDALTLHPYKVFQMDSYKLDRMYAKWGFKYFRVIKLEQSGLTVKVTGQAYPEKYYTALESLETPLPRGGGSPITVGGGPGGGGGPGDRPFPVEFDNPVIDPDGIRITIVPLIV